MLARRPFVVLASLVALAGCDSGGTTNTVDARVVPPGIDGNVPMPDAYVGPAVDAPVDPATDANVPPGTDAWVEPSVDAFVPGADAPMSMGGSPAARGPFSVTTSMATVTRDRRSTPVTAWVPTLPTGTVAPLVLFLPGFQLTTANYAGTLEHLASHGFVVVGANPSASLFSANHVEMAADGRAVIDWATGPAPFSSSVDASRIGVSGHSLGGKLATLITMDDARIDGLFAIDPVDGDPSPLGGGSADRPDLVPSRGADLRVPVGFLGETTNAMGGFMPCAPAAQNFMQFYAAATAAPWAAQWDVTGADHMDFLDDPRCGLPCSSCPDGPADDAAVLASTRTLATAFMRRHLLGETAMEAYLTGGSVPGGIVTMHRP
ncbi:MAG: hypothetical protein OHK0013_14990 [Sandaracinaceae bacterium]